MNSDEREEGYQWLLANSDYTVYRVTFLKYKNADDVREVFPETPIPVRPIKPGEGGENE